MSAITYNGHIEKMANGSWAVFVQSQKSLRVYAHYDLSKREAEKLLAKYCTSPSHRKVTV